MYNPSLVRKSQATSEAPAPNCCNSGEVSKLASWRIQGLRTPNLEVLSPEDQGPPLIKMDHSAIVKFLSFTE